jgi:hypothetical protein
MAPERGRYPQQDMPGWSIRVTNSRPARELRKIDNLSETEHYACR